jgi:NAD(P)H-hydrate repair Nnr-like enzyme with NAD(P)H-hydrate epimerase domain
MEELLTPQEMARVDALAGKEAALVAAAGRAVARAVMRRYAPCRVVVLAGPGNNGADGRVAGRFLAQAGWPVKILAVT